MFLESVLSHVRLLVWYVIKMRPKKDAEKEVKGITIRLKYFN